MVDFVFYLSSRQQTVTKISAEDMKICWLVLANKSVQYLDLFRFEHTIIIEYVTVEHYDKTKILISRLPSLSSSETNQMNRAY